MEIKKLINQLITVLPAPLGPTIRVKGLKKVITFLFSGSKLRIPFISILSTVLIFSFFFFIYFANDVWLIKPILRWWDSRKMFSGVRKHREHRKEKEERERGFWLGGTLASDEAQWFFENENKIKKWKMKRAGSVVTVQRKQSSLNNIKIKSCICIKFYQGKFMTAVKFLDNSRL